MCGWILSPTLVVIPPRFVTSARTSHTLCCDCSNMKVRGGVQLSHAHLQVFPMCSRRHIWPTIHSEFQTETSCHLLTAKGQEIGDWRVHHARQTYRYRYRPGPIVTCAFSSVTTDVRPNSVDRFCCQTNSKNIKFWSDGAPLKFRGARENFPLPLSTSLQQTRVKMLVLFYWCYNTVPTSDTVPCMVLLTVHRFMPVRFAGCDT